MLMLIWFISMCVAYKSGIGMCEPSKEADKILILF